VCPYCSAPPVSSLPVWQTNQRQYTALAPEPRPTSSSVPLYYVSDPRIKSSHSDLAGLGLQPVTVWFVSEPARRQAVRPSHPPLAVVPRGHHRLPIPSLRLRLSLWLHPPVNAPQASTFSWPRHCPPSPYPPAEQLPSPVAHMIHRWPSPTTPLLRTVGARF
ncbi:hypothetical protein C8Q74DRAFT_1428061, partial [Fomes fomentarius]